MTRPDMERGLVATVLLLSCAAVAAAGAQDGEPLAIGSRREPFVDSLLIESMTNARLKLHEPRLAGVALRLDQPWEEYATGYTTVLKDGDRYRMYYRGYQYNTGGPKKREFTCVAESRDGIAWERPDVGLVEFAGSTKNNILLADIPECHNFAPFLDARPDVPADQRYKALAGYPVLTAWASADGVRWRKLRDEPVMTKGAFDSQNVAFFSAHERRYVAYFRVFRDGFRSIARATSDDFLTWSEPVAMDFGDTRMEHLYTNGTTPYFRAPHVYFALPSRYVSGPDAVPSEARKRLGQVPEFLAPGKGFNDCVFMSSRAGTARFDRTFMEALIRPGIGVKHWSSRANYPACGIVPSSDDPDAMWMYVEHENGYESAYVARYVVRNDGFISVNAPYTGGEMRTHPITFSGRALTVNFATSAPGSVRVSILDAAGREIPGFTDAETDALVGNETARVVTWGGKSDVGDLAGKPVRLRFIMYDADLYSIQFVEQPGDAGAAGATEN